MDEMTCLGCGKAAQPIECENQGIICGHCGRKYTALEMAQLDKSIVIVTEVDEEGE